MVPDEPSEGAAGVGRPSYDAASFAPGFRPPAGLVVLVGGVGELYQRDLDLGRHVVGALRDELHGDGTFVEDLSYGAIPFTHRLLELEPDVLVLVGAVDRDRPPGSVRRRVVREVVRTPDELQGAMGDAYVGYVDLDLAVDVAHALGLLPDRTVLVEVQPAAVGPGDRLTDTGRAAVDRAARVVRDEVALAPLFELHAQLAARHGTGVLGDGPLATALGELVAALAHVDGLPSHADGEGWGPVYAARDRLRRAVAGTAPGGAMDHADWGMLWAAVEELGRLQRRVLLDDA